MPRYDPILEKMVPTAEERALAGEFEDMRRAIRTARDEIVAETDQRTRALNRNAMDASNVLVVIIIANLLATVAIAIKLWFFA